MKSRIVVLVKLPPPHTGATAMNKIALETLQKQFEVMLLDLSYNQSVDGLGNFSISKLKQTLANYLVFIRLLKGQSIDLIYFQISPLGVAFFRDCVFVLIAKLFKVKLIYHLHGKGIKEFVSKSRLKRFVYRWAFKKEEIICLSPKITSDVAGLTDKKPHILANCLESFTNLDQSQAKCYDFMFLSNLLLSKGILQFLDSMAEVVSFYPEAKALIIGKEADLTSNQLINEIESRKLEGNIDFRGAIFGNDKFSYYAKSRVFVFPTLNDIWGLVVLEAFSQSVPVIASEDGAIADMVINQKTGQLVRKGNSNELATAMISSMQHPEEWKKMGNNAKSLFELQFTREQFEKKLVEIVHFCTR